MARTQPPLLQMEALIWKLTQAEHNTARTATPWGALSPFNGSPHSRFLPAFPQMAAQALSPIMEASTQAKVASGQLSSFSSSSVFQLIQTSSSELLDWFPKWSLQVKFSSNALLSKALKIHLCSKDGKTFNELQFRRDTSFSLKFGLEARWPTQMPSNLFGYNGHLFDSSEIYYW